MKASSRRMRYGISFLLALAVVSIWLTLPNLRSGEASVSRTARGAAQQSTSAVLDAERQAALEKLLAQWKAGAPFSEEETSLLRRFDSEHTLLELEADVLISRALYDYYIQGLSLTREQEVLFDQYREFVARRSTDVLDLKTQLRNRRRAYAATAPRSNVPLVAPPNDTCAGAEVIAPAGPFPFFTAVTADITGATTTGDPPAPSCQTSVSHSIWYTFTPSTTAVYTISSCSFDGTSSTVDDTTMAIYTSSGGCAGPFTEIPSSGLSDGCDDDSCVSAVLQSVITTRLNAGTQYFIVMYQCDAFPPIPGNTAIQLKVTQFALPVNDTCAGAIALALDTPVNGKTDFASDDYELSGSACFTGLGQTASTATGNDVVYSFTAPVAGNYSFKVTNFDSSSRLVLYTASTCPAATPGTPVTVATCLSAANRSLSSSSEEVMCQSLSAGQQIFIFVDQNTLTSGSSFTIEANFCTREVEPNDTPATASTFVCGVEGTINPAAEADFYSVGTPAAGARAFAMIDGVAGNSNDFDLRLTTATDTLEYDDKNNDAPFGTLGPNLAGTPVTGVPTFLRVSTFSNQSIAAVAAEPYRLYYVLQPPGANANCNCSATNESEPNDTPAQANSAANNFFYGTLSGAGPGPSTDVDLYSFTAKAGELIFLSLDGDPKRDNTPINGALDLLDANGAVLLSVNDTDSISCPTDPCGTGYPTCTHPSLTCYTPQSPSEGLLYRAMVTGTYYARVYAGTTNTGPEGVGDYLLSISRSCYAGQPPTASIAGTLSYCIDPAKKVPGAVVAAVPPATTSTSDLSGNYNLTGLTQGGNYSVVPSKATDVNGIKAQDIGRLRRFVAALDTPTACQQMASDANNSGGVDAPDIDLLRHYEAFLPGTGSAGTWKFNPASRFYPNLITNQTAQNFDAVLVGDVDGDWIPPTSLQSPAAATASLTVTLPSLTAAPGTAGLTVPVAISGTLAAGDNVLGYRLVINFDPTRVVPSNPSFSTAGTISSSGNVTDNTSTPGQLVLLVDFLNPLVFSGSQTLINVKFNVVGTAGQMTNLTWNPTFPPEFGVGAPTISTTSVAGHLTIQGIDFDGDGKADVGVFRPSTGTWLIINSSNGSNTIVGWGTTGDIPVAADYDGDGKPDVAIWRPSTGVWWILKSSNGATMTVGWGLSTDVPVPADYDGDGKVDIAVWRPSTGTWFIIKSSNGAIMQVVWGTSGDVPTPADYDSDGKADIGVFRPSTGTWLIINSSNGSNTIVGWGTTGDIPVAADYDGDGKPDVAIWRPSTGVWWILKSSNGATMTVGWGLSTDVPVPADYDGDGKVDVAVWRPSTGTWFIIKSSNGAIMQVVWGTTGDVPIVVKH